MSLFGGNPLGASTPAKPGLFSTFGTNTSTSNTSFGAVAPNTQPTFGGFGSVTSTAPPAFGFTQSQPTTSGFGCFATGVQAPNTSLFSTPTFGSFGTTNTNTSVAPTFGGFGTGTSTASAPAFGGFGSTVTTSTAPTFGGFGTSFNLSNTFGKTAASATTVTPGFGAFGGSTSFMLGQPQQHAPAISPDEAFAQSIFNVSIFGDERDSIIAKWNYLQAMWGKGKSFYSQSTPPVEITPTNYLCRFKAMGYSRLPGRDNKSGLVALNFSKSLEEINRQQQQILNTLNNILGNKQNLIAHIDSTKEHEDKKCQYVIYVEEKSGINDIKRILATELANFLIQPNVKAQLNTICVTEVLALVLPDDDQLKEYLEIPPKGIDPRMWRQAKLDNPDSNKLIPVPIIGFNALKWRTKCQENETEMHALYLKRVEKDLQELRQRHATTTAKIMEHKRLLAELSHKVLTIIVKQECTRKVGLALTAEEESLRTKLENMQALISAPTQFKGRLSELLSQMRMQRSQYSITNGGKEYIIDKENEDEIKSFLYMQQKAMEVLTDTVTKDLKAIQIILDGMPELIRN